MALADLTLALANVIYATSYVTTRLVLEAVPPATLALLRAAIGAAILLPLARGARPATVSRHDRGRIAAMGVVGFGAAFALSHWGLARSTATNAALLIAVEPLTLVLAGPALLGERLRRREALGAALAMAGAVVVVANGVPGVTATLAPTWRGDLLLLLSGVAYAAYSLLGRSVLGRLPAVSVTARSSVWGAVALLPLAAMEWLAGRRPSLDALAVTGVLYLAVVITALGYLVWNYGLQRVPASRAAVFLNLQPVVGAILGAAILDEPVTAFIVAGGALVVAGLSLTMGTARP